MRNKIFAMVVVMAIVLVSLAGCGNGVSDSIKGIEGIWVDSDSLRELTFNESGFAIAYHSVGWGCKGTYSLTNNDELKLVITEVEIFDWNNEVFAEYDPDNPDDVTTLTDMEGEEAIMPFSLSGDTLTFFIIETGAEDIFTRKV